MIQAFIMTIELPTPSFEFHTHVFGSKMILQMGYNDGKLGNNGHGISHSIQPVMRPTKDGLGLVETPSALVSCLNPSTTHTQFVLLLAPIMTLLLMRCNGHLLHHLLILLWSFHYQIKPHLQSYHSFQ